MAGLITLLDGEPGTGKSTFACGLPEPRAVLDADIDGWRWLKSEAKFYEGCRDADAAKAILLKWAGDKTLNSIIVDPWSFWWQTLQTQVIDNPQDKNKFRSWGSAKLVIKRLYKGIQIAKANGKHVLLTAHVKDDIKADDSGGKTEIVKQGRKPNTEPDPTMLQALLDLHLRLVYSKITKKRWIEVVKCRPQSKVNGVWTPLLGYDVQIPVGDKASDKAYTEVLRRIGELPQAAAAPTIDEDAAAQNSMLNASINKV